MSEKIIIGRVEKIDFLQLELRGIDAKIDTGAYSSAIHCHDIEEDTVNGIVKFKLLDPSHPDYNEKVISIKDYSKAKVKSAFGDSEVRIKIRTSIIIGAKTYKTTFTLTDRSKMKFPVLLGRKLLNKRFMVDVGKTYIQSNKEK